MDDDEEKKKKKLLLLLLWLLLLLLLLRLLHQKQSVKTKQTKQKTQGSDEKKEMAVEFCFSLFPPQHSYYSISHTPPPPQIPNTYLCCWWCCQDFLNGFGQFICRWNICSKILCLVIVLVAVGTQHDLDILYYRSISLE